MITKTAVALLAAATFAAAFAASAGAACSDPPPPPIKLRPQALKPRPDLNPNATAITLFWENRASESQVCFEAEARGPGSWKRVVPFAACGRGGKGAGKSHTFLQLKPATRYCFRLRALTEGGICRSPWSAEACATTAAMPAPPPDKPPPEKPRSGGWVAVAADGKGAWGFAHNFATDPQARAAALKSCHSAACKVELAGQARCFAYVHSRSGGYWYGISIGPTQAQVVRNASRVCKLNAPAGTCKVAKVLCG